MARSSLNHHRPPSGILQASRPLKAKLTQFKCQLVVWLVSMTCYANSFTGEFVFDDHEAIETNMDIRSTRPLMSIFKHDFWGEPIHSNTSHKSYRPLTILTFRLNYMIGGLEPAGYHLVNICLHGVVTALFTSTCFVIFRGMTSSTTNTLLASLLFAVHPIHTEAVANVVGRADVLCACFYLLSFLSYANCIPLKTNPPSSKTTPCERSGCRPTSHSRTWIAVSVVFCVLALLSKEQGLTIIAVCMAYDVLYICNIDQNDVMASLKNSSVILKRSWPKWVRRLAERLLVLMLSCVILLYVRIAVIGGGVPKTFVESDNPIVFHSDQWTRFRTYIYLCVFNTWLLLCPNTLCYDWSMDSIPRIETLWDARNVASCCFVLILVMLLWKALRLYTSSNSSMEEHDVVANGKPISSDINRNVTKDTKTKYIKAQNQHSQRQFGSSLLIGRTALQGLCMMVVPFLPASNLFFPVGFVVAERVLYIPSMGFCILAALGIRAVFANQQQQQETHESVQTEGNGENSITCLLSSLGLSVKGRWMFYALLILFAAKTVHRNMEWQHNGSLATAGLKTNPDNAKIHLSMGNYLAKKGLRSCESYYRESLRLRPHYTLAWVNLGLVLLNTDRAEEAEQCYEKALSLNPNSANANTNMANLLRITRRYEEAEYRYRKASSLRPDDPMLAYNLGIVLEELRKPKEAKESYLQSIALMPSHAKAYFAVTRILMEPLNDEPADEVSKNTLAMAEEYLYIGLRYDPHDIQARLLFAKLLLKRGETDLAKGELFYVLAQSPHNVEAEFLVGRAIEREGKLDEAKKLYSLILRRNHSHTKTKAALELLNLKIIRAGLIDT